MDRWEIQMTEAVPSLERHKQPVKYMLGYLGIGVDGKVGVSLERGGVPSLWWFCGVCARVPPSPVAGLFYVVGRRKGSHTHNTPLETQT